MKHHKLTALALFSLSAITAPAALTITNADIDADTNTYAYSLTYDDLTLPGNKFLNDISNPSNIAVFNGTRHYIASTNATSGSFEYHFDFSGTDYNVTSVTITDAANNMETLAPSSTITVRYKIGDTGEWQTLQINTPSSSAGLKTWPVIRLDTENPEGVSSFTYQVLFANTTVYPPEQPDWDRPAQWARSNTDGIPFEVIFTTVLAPVPEPATCAALLGLACLLLVAIRRLKKHR